MEEETKNKIWEECYECGSYNTKRNGKELVCNGCSSSFHDVKEKISRISNNGR